MKKLLSLLALCLLSFTFIYASSARQNFVVSGYVTDETHAAIVGATVVEQHTHNGAVTDFDGNFSLECSSKPYTLVISYIGYKTKVITDSVSWLGEIQLEPDTE